MTYAPDINHTSLDQSRRASRDMLCSPGTCNIGPALTRPSGPCEHTDSTTDESRYALCTVHTSYQSHPTADSIKQSPRAPINPAE